MKTSRSIRRLGGTRMLCLYRTCWTISAITFLLKNLVSNTTLQSTFCITISSSQPFSHILKARHPLTRTLGILIQLGKLWFSSIVKDITLNLKKTSCKQFYKLFAEKINTEPTAIKSWQNHCPEVADNWMRCMQSNLQIASCWQLNALHAKKLQNYSG